MWEAGEKQVLLQVEAAAITPADTYLVKRAIFKLEHYPTIISSVPAGIVRAVGPGVSKVKVGDRIVTSTNIWPSKGNPKFGSQQRYVVADELEITPIGETLDFPAAVASSFATPIQALFHPSMLNMTRPPSTATPAPANGKKILIWGASSAMGCLAVSHAKHAGYTVIATCSPNNIELLQSLGADHVFDRLDIDNTVQKIRALGDIHYFFDPVSKVESLHGIAKALEDENGKLRQTAEIVTLVPSSWLTDLKLPEGVTTKFLLFRNQAPENQEFVEWYSGYLESGLKGGWIRGARPTVIGGLDKVSEGVEMVSNGVSGQRIIIAPWKE
ncbi:GroES-like protein [Mycena kentingensis (nom. inval.)]|nr:GroES-like protein [Mycena kentingensis (nom. inval.)]